MQIGDIVKYTNTGTVGKIIAEKEQDGAMWYQLDITQLFYHCSALVPADDSEYHVFDQEKSLKDRLDDAEAARREFEDMVKDLVDVTPSGAG